LNRDERRTYITNAVADDLVAEAMHSNLTDSTAFQRQPSLLASAASQSNKTAFLRSVYASDPVHINSNPNPFMQNHQKTSLTESLFKKTFNQCRIRLK
jgi:hypothetical protein